MFNILKRFFNRRANTVRECPECGFKGNPKQFKKVKIMRKLLIHRGAKMIEKNKTIGEIVVYITAR